MARKLQAGYTTRRMAGPAEHRPQTRKRGKSPVTCDPDYSAEEVEFLVAVDAFKREHHCPFPTLTQLLAILRGLGWRKVQP